MKTYNATELGSRKRTEIFEAARTEGAVIQRKNTNGVVLEEFVMVSKDDEAIWLLYQASEKGEING